MNNKSISIIAIITVAIVATGLAVMPSLGDQQANAFSKDQIKEKVKDHVTKALKKIKDRLGNGGSGGGGCGVLCG